MTSVGLRPVSGPGPLLLESATAIPPAIPSTTNAATISTMFDRHHGRESAGGCDPDPAPPVGDD